MRRTLTKPQSKNVRPVLSQIYLIEAIPAYINQQQSSESYDRDAFLEEYIASVGYTIGSYVKEKDERAQNRWIVDFFNDKSTDSVQVAYKLMRYVPKIGKFNSLDDIPKEIDEWIEWYKGLERRGNTLAVISNAQGLNTFGTNLCTSKLGTSKFISKKLFLPENNIFITDNNNYFFDLTNNWKGSPIQKYDSTQKERYTKLQNKY